VKLFIWWKKSDDFVDHAFWPTKKAPNIPNTCMDMAETCMNEKKHPMELIYNLTLCRYWLQLCYIKFVKGRTWYETWWIRDSLSLIISQKIVASSGKGHMPTCPHVFILLYTSSSVINLLFCEISLDKVLETKS